MQAVKVIVRRRFKEGKTKGVFALLNKFRSDAMEQSGYISGETLRHGLEIKIKRLPGIEKILVYLGKVTKLDRMVACHGMAALKALCSQQERQTVVEHVEIHSAVVVIEIERVVECR